MRRSENLSSAALVSILIVFLCLLLPACDSLIAPLNSGVIGGGETARVESVIDGDTIEVSINGVSYRVRYIGINTPEIDEVCYREARDANRALVERQTVTLVRDVSNTDRFGRLLRYVYVGETFVNARLIADGWAEAVEYAPDTAQASAFRQLERAARDANLGCHPTGIFDDGSQTR